LIPNFSIFGLLSRQYLTTILQRKQADPIKKYVTVSLPSSTNDFAKGRFKRCRKNFEPLIIKITEKDLSPMRVHTGESEICDSKYFEALKQKLLQKRWKAKYKQIRLPKESFRKQNDAVMSYKIYSIWWAVTHTHITQLHDYIYLTITIPQARMGSESIAQEAELVGQKNIEIKHLSLVKARL